MAVSKYNDIGHLLGGRFMFESKNYPDEFWRHKCWKLWREKRESSGLYQLDTSFDIIPGLCGTGVSFRSVNYPDYFIRHYCGECFIGKPRDGASKEEILLFKRDASWIPHEGIADSNGVSFESENYRGEFIRHYCARVRKDRNDGSKIFDEDATWYPKLLKSPKISRNWKLIFANDNSAASGKYTLTIEIGTEITKSSAITASWEKDPNNSACTNTIVSTAISALSSALKAMFDCNSTVSHTRVDSSAFKVHETKKETLEINLNRGEPVHLWQLCFTAVLSDSTCVTAKTQIYKQTINAQPPNF